MVPAYIYTLVWSFIGGFLSYTISVNTMGGPWMANGKTEDYWNQLVAIYFALVVSHHLQILIMVRNYTFYMVFFQVFSFLMCIPLTVWMNDDLGGITNQYYKTQFSEVLQSPLFYLSVALQTFIHCLPFIIYRLAEDTIIHP